MVKLFWHSQLTTDTGFKFFVSEGLFTFFEGLHYWLLAGALTLNALLKVHILNLLTTKQTYMIHYKFFKY